MIFPDNLFLKMGVPALLAFLPQTAFYSIQNDVLSPLCFGAAFICLVKLLRADTPGVRLGTATGLALAATYLTKISNLPLLAVSGAWCAVQNLAPGQGGKIARRVPGAGGAGVVRGPADRRLAGVVQISFRRFHRHGGENSISRLDAQIVRRMVAASDFHAARFMDLFVGALATFWQGEFLWHRQPLASPVVDAIYAISSIGFVGVAVAALLFRSNAATGPQRQALWFGFLCLVAAVAFLGFLSIIYDFQDCFYPSRAHPYFTSGRLMLGALIPFLLLFVYGLDCALGPVEKPLGETAGFDRHDFVHADFGNHHRPDDVLKRLQLVSHVKLAA
jgi:hypothetical protein